MFAKRCTLHVAGNTSEEAQIGDSKIHEHIDTKIKDSPDPNSTEARARIKVFCKERKVNHD